MTSRSGDTEIKLFSVRNRSEGAVLFRLTGWKTTPRHDCLSWHLRDSFGNTVHPETGAEYRAWEEYDNITSPKRITFRTNLPATTEWFDVGLTEVLPEMVELEFPPKASP